MQWLAAISVKRPVFASVIILVFVVVGVLGYTRLPVDRFPKIDFPTVSIVTRQDGATPKEIETEIAAKIIKGEVKDGETITIDIKGDRMTF